MLQHVVVSQNDSLSIGKKVLTKLTSYNWEKDYVDMKDGSILLDPSVGKKAVMCLIFRKNGTGTFIHGENASPFRFQIADSILIINAVEYKIHKLNDFELVFDQYLPNTNDDGIKRFHYLATTDSPTEIYLRKHIKPFISISALKDTAFLFNEEVYPEFLGNLYTNKTQHTGQTFEEVHGDSYNFIEKAFLENIPKNTEGVFKVSFTVNTKGLVQDIVVNESTQEAYNAKLVGAILSTNRLWIPATWQNKKYPVKFQYIFQLVKEKPNLIEFDPVLYNEYFNRANSLMARKNYDKAVKIYTKCVLMTDDAIEAIYKRAECYEAMKITKNACSDWSYLASKGLKKAEKLFLEKCAK